MLERPEITKEYSQLMNQKVRSDVKFIPLKDEFVKSKLPGLYQVVCETAEAFGLLDRLPLVGNTFALSVQDHFVKKIYEPEIYLDKGGLAIRWGSQMFPLKEIVDQVSHKTDYQFKEINNNLCFAYLASTGPALPFIRVYSAPQKEGQKESMTVRIQRLSKAYNEGDWEEMSKLVAQPIIIPESMSVLKNGSYKVTHVGKKKIPYEGRFFTAYRVALKDYPGYYEAKGPRFEAEINMVLPEENGFMALKEAWDLEITGVVVRKGKNYAEYRLTVPVASLNLDFLLDPAAAVDPDNLDLGF